MSESPSGAAAQHLSWEMNSWTSIDFRVHHGFSDGPTVERSGLPSGGGSIDEHFIETAAGQRFGEELLHPPVGSDSLFANYDDANRCASTSYEGGHGSRQIQVIYKSAFGREGKGYGTSRPIPLKYFFVERTPLPEMLPKATWVGTKEVLGRDCDVFLFPQVRWHLSPQDSFYALDRETGIPLEVRSYETPEARRQDRPLWTWEAKSFDEVEGYHFPLKSVETTYLLLSQRGSGPEADEPAQFRELTVNDLHYNREYPLSTFQPTIEPGATVWDQVNNTHHVVPGTVAPVADPVRITPPRGWTSLVSMTSLSLGIAVLVVGLIAWRRRG